MSDPRETLKSHITAVIEGLRHLDVDSAADLIAEVADDLAEGGLDLHDIHQIAMLVELCSLDADFDHIGVGVREILTAPVTSDQVVIGDEVSCDGNGVHGNSSVLSVNIIQEFQS